MSTPENLLKTPTLESAVQRSVDQAIVDGFVDGKERRAKLSTLSWFTFDRTQVPEEISEEFKTALIQEERFVDMVGKRYGYVPELSGEHDVKPSLTAVVGGTAMTTPEERLSAEVFMDSLAQAVYGSDRAVGGMLTLRQIHGIINGAAGGNVANEEYKAFVNHMRNNSRFHVVEDGRVYLTDIYGTDFSDIVEIPHMDEQVMTEFIETILPRVRTDRNRNFSKGAVIGAFEEYGVPLRNDQLNVFYRKLLEVPGMKQMKDGKFHWYRSTDAASHTSD